MHHKTTEFATQMLDHTKKLIKQLDEAKFPYNRQEVMTLLHAFATAHNKKHERETVDNLQALLDRTEQLEHQYHEWMTEQTQKTSVDEIKTVLGGFHEKTLTTMTNTQRPPRSPRQHWVETTTCFHDYLLLLLCVAMGATFLLGGTPYMWYFLIVLALLTLVILYAKWIVTKRGRVFVIASLIGGWVVFLT